MSLLSFLTVGLIITITTVDFNTEALSVILRSVGINTITDQFSVVFYQSAFPRITITLIILIVQPLCIDTVEMLGQAILKYRD
jgi:hypothetical protein